MEITRTLTNGMTLVTEAEPTATAGLLVAPVLTTPSIDEDTEADPTAVVADEQWVVVHEHSGRPVTPLGLPHLIAHRFAYAVANVDWTVDRDTIRNGLPSDNPYLTAVNDALQPLAEFVGLTDSDIDPAEDGSEADDENDDEIEGAA